MEKILIRLIRPFWLSYFATALAVINPTSKKWMVATPLLFALPAGLYLLGQRINRPTGRIIAIYALWAALFLLIQTLWGIVSPDLYKTLSPNLKEQVRFEGDLLPGVQGLFTVTTDSMGFRTNRSINYEDKPDNTLRIFAIGGSTTEQIYLDDRQTWLHLLGQSLERAWPDKRVETINTGVSGLRSEHHLATMNKILPYQPDLLLFLVGINDWVQHTVDHFSTPWQRIKNFQRRLWFNKTPLAQWMAGHMPSPKIIKPEGHIRRDVGGYYRHRMDALKKRKDQRKFHPAKVHPQYADNLERIARICQRHNLSCLFLTQPSAYREDISEALLERLWMTPTDQPYTLTLKSLIHLAMLYNSHLKSFAKQNSMPLCDIAAHIDPTTDYLYDDCHFNRGGARKVAQLLGQCILQDKILR